MSFVNIDSTKPAGNEKIATVDNYIRELKGDIEINLAEISGYPNNSAIKNAIWTTLTRPTTNLVTGLTGFNTDLDLYEHWDGTQWVKDSISQTEVETIANSTSETVTESYFDTDTTLTANSDNKVATQKAVKTYIDTSITESAETNAIKVTVIQDVKSSGTNGGTSSSGNWYTRTLNTYQINQIGLDAISSNRFTLPAGTYNIRACSFIHNVAGVSNQIRIYNVTDATSAILGLTNMNAFSDYSSSVWATLDGCIEIASSKTFELQYRCSYSSSSSYALGQASGWGNEIYSIVSIMKIG